MTPTPQAAWKGLDPNQKPVFLGYDQIERMVAALLDRAAAWRPDEVVGISRGGLVPAAMAAGILARPLSFVGHDKASGVVTWIGPPAKGRRILLVDDCCSSGMTLNRAAEMLRQEGRECLTLVVVYDPDVARIVPDLSHTMRALFRLPWERGEATPTGRAAKASGPNLDLDVEAPFHGLWLDEALSGALMADPGGTVFPRTRAVLFSELPETGTSNPRTQLAATVYGGLPLSYRPAGGTPEDISAVRWIAEAAIRWGCTHFVVCDPDRAIRLAAEVPHLIVTRWCVRERRGWIVGAAARPFG